MMNVMKKEMTSVIMNKSKFQTDFQTNLKTNLVKIIFVSIFCVAISFSHLSYGQSNSEASRSPFRKGLATVMFAGLGGAVLGLSTLSFYGQPQEHIGNIWLGLGIGLFAGAGYVMVQNTPTNSYSFEQEWRQQSEGDFDKAIASNSLDNTHRISWMSHQVSGSSRTRSDGPLNQPIFQWATSF